MKKQIAYSHSAEEVNTHHPFSPQEIRSNDPIGATLFSQNKEINAKVWRISPVGIEVIPSEQIQWDKECTITIQIGQENSTLKGVLTHQYNFQNKDIYCIRFVFEQRKWNKDERRSKNRWNCSSRFFPTGMAHSPAKYNDFIYFKIKDISYGGMKISCSLRNKFLFPKMTLDALINFPMVSQINLKLKIINLNIGSESGKDVINMGVSYDTTDSKTNEVITNYLLQFSDVSSLEELKSHGFSSKKLSSAIDFSYVKSKEEYVQCLELRAMANKMASKVNEDLQPDSMADEYDTRSRIVMGYHQGKAVCTVRMAFHEIDDKMEIEKYAILPESFPRRDEVVEIMRLCTHPSYRGSDLLMSLFKHLAITVVQSRRRFIVASCVEDLIPLYKKIGFQETGVLYENPLFPGFPDHVVIANIETLLLGKGINPIVWNIVWGDLYKYFDSYGLVDYSPLDRLKVKVMRSLNPISKIVGKYSTKRKK